MWYQTLGSKLFQYGIPAGLGFLGMTVVIDSIFWNRPLWPEGEVLWFNTILNKSSEYGTSPFLWYFYSAIPRGMAASVFLLPLGLYLDERVRKIIVPAVLFVFLYSFLPHKELRFIIYVFPVLNIPVATACYRLWENRNKSLIQYLLSIGVLGHLGVNVMFTLLLLCISGTNYPGGTAISHFHRLAKDETHVNVHISNLAAQTGVSRFTQISDNWTYSKTENLLAGSQQMYEYTHIIAEAKSKFSPNLKPYTFTHDIVDIIEAFNQVSFNYMTIPPVKIRMKPVLFILKRKKNYKEMLNMRNFHESDEEDQEQQSKEKSNDNELTKASTDNEPQLEEQEENYTENFPEEEDIKNVPQVFSEEIMSEETKVNELNIPKQVPKGTLNEKLMFQDSSEDDIDGIILRPEFMNKKKNVVDSVDVTKTMNDVSEKSQKKKLDSNIAILEDIDNIAAVKIEELKLKRSNVLPKKKNYQVPTIVRKESVNKHIEKKIVHAKENEIEREISEETDLKDQENETETVDGGKEIIDFQKDSSFKEQEVDQNKIDEILEELKANDKFSRNIDKPRKAMKLANSDKKDSMSAIKMDATLKTKLKIEALELAAKKKIYEQKSDENKQQVKRNLKKLIQKYRRKKSDDINTNMDEKHDESVPNVMHDETNKQRDEITKINSQIMEIIENNPNIANKDLIKEKLQTTIINELIKVIDDKIVEKTGKQISAKDNIKTRKLVEAIELKKIKDTKPSNIVQSDEILDYDEKVKNPPGVLDSVKEVSKFDREEKIKEAQAKIEDIMNIIDEIVETIEIHNIN